MADFDRILKRARRRMVVNDALRLAAVGLLVAAGAGLAAVAGDRLLGAPLPWVVYPALCGAGLLGGAAAAVVRRPSLETVAIRLDERLRLKDRLGTAAAIERGRIRRADESFLAIILADANRHARDVDVRPASPITVAPAWGGAAIASIALAAAVLFVPRIAWGESEMTLTPGEQVELEQTRAEAAETLDEALRELESDGPTADAATADDLAALDELAGQLKNKDLPPEEFAASRDAAAERLNDLAEEFERQAMRERSAVEELAEQFRGMEPPEAGEESPGFAREFEEALRRGDFDRAAEMVQNLQDRAAAMSDEERRDLAEGLRDLNERLERQQQRAERERAAREQALRDAMQRQGADEQTADQLLDERTTPPSRDEVEQTLREQGVDEQVARDLAEEVERQRNEQQAQRDAAETAERLSESLDDMAREMEQSQPPTPPQPPGGETSPDEPEQQPTGEQSPDQQQKERDPTQGDQSERPQGEQQQKQTNEGQERQQQRQQQESGPEGQQRQTGEQQQRQTQEGAAEQQQQSQGAETTEGAPKDAPRQGEGERQPGRQQTSDQSQPGGEQQAAKEAEQPPQAPESARERPGAGRQPGGPGEQQQQSARPGDPEQPPAGERLRETLEQLEQQRESAERRGKQSERMRDAARRMAEQMTPEERRRFQEWAEQMQREQQPGGDQQPDGQGRGLAGDEPGLRGDDAPTQRPPVDDGAFEDIDDVDLREDDPGRTVAEWLADDDLEGRPGRTTEGGGDPVGEARKAAERAVDETSVPTRYHELIRRYFRQLDDTAQKARESRTGGGSEGGGT